MESPPPYMPPRKKSNTGLIVGLIIGGVVLCCLLPIGVIVGGGFWAFNKTKGLIQCSYAYTDVRDALNKYAAEHDGKLPPADTWMDEVAPYYEQVLASNRQDERKMFGTMPSTGAWGCDNGDGGRTGMALNDDVAGKELTKLVTSNDVVLFEVQNALRNAHEKYSEKSEIGGPKIFGEHRGWFLIRMSGSAMLLEKGHESPIDTH